MPENFKELEEALIQVGLRIAKRGEGALFVVGEVDYKVLIDQNVPPFLAVENPKLLESLALIDGAVIIKKDGLVEAYGAMVKSKFSLKNFGTRHSAALTASKKSGNLVIIISEEDRKIRIMKEGKVVMQIDALQKDIEKSVPKAIQLLESIGAGTIGTIGTGIIVPSLGIALLPGIIIFGSAYYLGRFLTQKIYK
ncbi:MAG: DNA integrity scanning protein DisA nucleotide-binding domain protein [Nanoarchaeota archaeon]|nr:DNA integrity scanning protein DisA nucleotide-binding domain protein [Nanoarchaeota archaeon]